MMQKRILSYIVLILIVAEGSHASLFGEIRELVESEPKAIPAKVLSPSPSPVSSVNFNKTKSDKASNSSNDESTGSSIDEKCKMSLDACHDQGNLTACLQFSGEDPGKLFLLIQNDGETTLTVKGDILPKISFKEQLLQKHQSEKINITSANIGENIVIILNAGNGGCTIRMGTPSKSEANYFQLVPAYAAQVNPVYGAYLLSLTVVIIGGTWAYCKWGRKGSGGVDGVPYQELEMGRSAENGWDEDWDNDWDDEEQPVKKGINSRPVIRKGGWDD